MRAKVSFALLLKIATSFSISFVICFDHKDHPYFGPTEPKPILPDDDPTVIQSNCESACNRSGKYTLCGNDRCTYSGYKELECVHKCGRPVKRYIDGECKSFTPPPPNGWIQVKKCV